MSTVVTGHRQFGSKARVAHRLLQLVPSDVKVWVEGFAGTAAMTIAKAPHKAEHINDLNGDVVGLFSVLRDDAALARLCHLLELTPYAQAEFLACRDHVSAIGADADPDPVERARRFLVASWQSVGGKQCAHASWRLHVSFASRSSTARTWSGVPDRLIAIAQRLRQVHIHRRHITDLVAMFDREPTALLFLDPPYPRHTLAGHERMYAVDMEDAEHQALAEQLRTVRCRVLMTMAGGGAPHRLRRGALGLARNAVRRSRPAQHRQDRDRAEQLSAARGGPAGERVT